MFSQNNKEITRDQKEALIRSYFNSQEKKPKFSNFSFSVSKSFSDIDLKYIGATVFLKQFIKNKEGRDVYKDRTFFFVFLNEYSKDIKLNEYYNELYEVASYFNKISIIKVVFVFTDKTRVLKYSEAKGFQKDSLGSEVDGRFDFVKNPDQYIEQLINNRKHLLDCYKAFIGTKENTELDFISNDYYDTRFYLNNLVEAIEKGYKLIYVHGPAGSGKTILALRLLGLYKRSQMLIINSYFDQELRSIFEEMKNKDIRFFNHRGEQSDEIVTVLSYSNKYKISPQAYYERFNKYLYAKYNSAWQIENPNTDKSKFWEYYKDTQREDYEDDFEEFAQQQDKYDTPAEILIVDEGQRIYQETIDVALKNNLTIILLGDSYQKINPDTDNLNINPEYTDIKDIQRRYQGTYYELSLRYPIRITGHALEKINYLLGKSNEKKYVGGKENYPIEIFDKVQVFVETYRKDKTSQKFFASYQDIWRFEQEKESNIVETKKVNFVRMYDKYVLIEFTDGTKVTPNKQSAYRLSESINIRLMELRGHNIKVRYDNENQKYRLANKSKLDEQVYYGKNELILFDSSIKSIKKADKESKTTKSNLLFAPNLKGKIFTPFELISRECRNIYLFLPKGITIENNQIVDKNLLGSRFLIGETNYLLNQIYVLLTRATNRIRIYVEDQVLKEYFKSKLEEYEVENTLF